MHRVEDYGLLGVRATTPENTRLMAEVSDIVAEVRLRRWRREQATVSDRNQPVPRRLPASIRRRHAREARRPVLGEREYRSAGPAAGPITIIEPRC